MGSTKRQAGAFGDSLSRAGRSGALSRLLVLPLSLCALACLLSSSSVLAAETRPQIETFGPDGTSATQFGEVGAIAVDQGTHDIYVADYGSGKVEKFDENHAPSNFSALASNEIGGFSFSSGEALQEIAVNSTSHAFYVADYGNGVIKAFQQSGAPLSFTAGPGSGSNELPQFSEVCGVAVDSSGDIYMGDYGTGVHVFEPSGEELATVPVSEPCNVAVDSSGAVYVARYVFGFPARVERFSPKEFPVTSSTTYSPGKAVDPTPTYALAVDPSSDDLYAYNPSHAIPVSVYDSSGALRYEFGSGASSEGIAVDGGTGKAYVSDGGSGRVRVFGAPVPLPSLTTEDADEIAATTATLHGTVNPEDGQLTDCHFETVPAAQFESDEYESVTAAQEAPCVPAAGSIPADSNPHVVEANATGLSPGTTYHVRLVASTAEGASSGNDHVFTTAISAPTVSSQKAEAIGNTDAILSANVNPKSAKTTYHVEYGTTAAYGQSTLESSPIGFGGDDSAHTVGVHVGGLSPGTAYHFRFVATSLAGKVEGADTTFATYPSTPLGGGACPNEEFRTGFGERLPDCRAYEQVTPVDKHGANVQGAVAADQASSTGDRATFYLSGGLPSTGGSSTFSAYVASRGAEGWSSDGLLPLLEPARKAEIVGWSEDLTAALDTAQTANHGTDLYLRESNGTYRLIAHNSGPERATFGNFAADPSHLTFEVRAPLLPDAAAGKENLYEIDHGTLTLPGRIPVAPATSCDDSSGPACVFAPQGATSAFNNSSQERARHSSLSRDGSKVFFLDRASKQLYVREDGARTTQISASQKTNGSGPGGSDPLGPQPAEFREASRDGAHVYFTSHEELTDDANTGLAPAIGRADLDGSGANHTFVPASATGVAVDGSHIYWVNTNAGTITRSNLDGTGVNESFIIGANKPQYVAVDGSHIYWTNAANGANGAGTIGRANLDGTGVEQSFISGASNPRGIAVDGSHIYWANAGTTEATRAIARANLDGTSPEQSFVPVERTFGPVGVAVSSSFIYWTDPADESRFEGRIGRANLDGTSPQQNLGIFAGIAPSGIALDGTYLYWANNNGFEGIFGEDSFGPSIGRVKLDGSEETPNFIRIARSSQGVAVDGSHIYWAGGDDRDTGTDLYSYDSASGSLTDISAGADPANSRGAEVKGFVGASPDGSYVYFAANGVLAPGASQGGALPDFSVITNLYLSHAGTTTFVAQLEQDNQGDGNNWSANFDKTSRVADDGTLVFSSHRLVDLSGHDHGSCGLGFVCTEFYRYTPADEGLACITCATTGSPSAAPSLSENTGYFLGYPPSARVTTRNLSADGRRFFFNTQEALVPADTNGVLDVYEWEAKGSGSCESESQNGGCLYLISSGTSPEASQFLDASASGDDAFFFTEQQLVPGDSDDLIDVYDASVGGGLASQHQLTPPTCSTTACQANPAPPPDPSTASSSYRGAGNVHKAPATRRCPKGKRKVRRGGKVRCQKAARHHKRHSDRGGSK